MWGHRIAWLPCECDGPLFLWCWISASLTTVLAVDLTLVLIDTCITRRQVGWRCTQLEKKGLNQAEDILENHGIYNETDREHVACVVKYCGNAYIFWYVPWLKRKQKEMLSDIWCVPPWQEDITDKRRARICSSIRYRGQHRERMFLLKFFFNRKVEQHISVNGENCALKCSSVWDFS